MRLIPKSVFFLIIPSIVILLLKIFCFDTIPELFPGAHELGLLIEPIIISIISSFIFYLIIFHYKEYKDNKYITKHLIGALSNIINLCDDIIKGISYEKLNIETMNFQDLDSHLSAIDNKIYYDSIKNSRDKTTYDNMLNKLRGNADRTTNTINFVLKFNVVISNELMSILMGIYNNVFFVILHGSVCEINSGFGDNRKYVIEEFIKYYELCIKLSKYIENIESCYDVGEND